ncbi:MAG: hypothetical protein ACE5KJ_07940 [Candidatus Zixiibacteriota bacterium]
MSPSKEGKKKRFKKRKRQKMFALLGLLGILVIVFSILYFSQNDKHLDSRRARLSRLTLPPDGSKLYSFLLREIPDIVSEIPCPCCGEYLDVCYKGRCPFT